jgi:hypothetical protein
MSARCARARKRSRWYGDGTNETAAILNWLILGRKAAALADLGRSVYELCRSGSLTHGKTVIMVSNVAVRSDHRVSIDLQVVRRVYNRVAIYVHVFSDDDARASAGPVRHGKKQNNPLSRATPFFKWKAHAWRGSSILPSRAAPGILALLATSTPLRTRDQKPMEYWINLSISREWLDANHGAGTAPLARRECWDLGNLAR